MGLAQCSRPSLRPVYVACFFLVLAYRVVPWSDWLLRAASG